MTVIGSYCAGIVVAVIAVTLFHIAGVAYAIPLGVAFGGALGLLVYDPE